MKKLAGTFLLLFFILCSYQNSTCQTNEVRRRYQHFSDSINAKIDYDKKNDSTAFYKNENGFRYMDNLDSLLRNIQKNIGQEITKEQKKDIGKSPDYSSINRFLSSKPVTIILWLMAITFALFIIYKFIYKGDFFKKGPRTKFLQENNPDKGKDASHFFKQLALQENAKMYNESIRLLFLITINKMSDKKLLLFSPDKTNRDYLMELEDPAINKEFSALVRTFEYCWYGKFKVSEERYLVIKKSFKEFNIKI